MAPTMTPHARLEKALTENLNGTLPGKIPTKWEKFSDVVILPQSAFTESGWDTDQRFWEIVADSLDVKRVARMGEVDGEYRKSGVELLLGEDDWVVRREHGIDFGYNFTQCMWSAGNVTERGRMANGNHEGEKILDLYAGIGYYTLPFLSEGARGPSGERGNGRGAAHVVACEWNPNAIRALKWSLSANDLVDRCTILEGDNRNLKLESEFNRVNLGLLPSAEEGYSIAIQSLKPEGGVLHVHGLAKSGEEEKWASNLATSLEKNGRFSCTVMHVERVKWYAPHQRHIVVDIHALPVSC
jgi:tRNA wybutosine-synthesizing protein 3